MENRMTRVLLLGILIALGVLAAQPYIERQFYSATTPRAIASRGDLADV